MLYNLLPTKPLPLSLSSISTFRWCGPVSPPWSRFSIVQTAEELAAASLACKSYIRYEEFRPLFVLCSSSSGDPPLDSETGGLESSGQRPISAINKTKRIAFFSPVNFFLLQPFQIFWKKYFFQIFWNFKVFAIFLEFFYLSFFLRFLDCHFFLSGFSLKLQW